MHLAQKIDIPLFNVNPVVGKPNKRVSMFINTVHQLFKCQTSLITFLHTHNLVELITLRNHGFPNPSQDHHRRRQSAQSVSTDNSYLLVYAFPIAAPKYPSHNSSSRYITDQPLPQVTFLQLLTQTPSPNPPGDTVQAASVITSSLESNGFTPEIIDPYPTAPNVVCDAQCGGEGKSLVLNGHSKCTRCVTSGCTQEERRGDGQEMKPNFLR